ncbi:MAG: hypothetical protein EBS05_22115 [Proteobacteria bacterium]|nr:hypothetical protein [Pseudomonadota bacterium]
MGSLSFDKQHGVYLLVAVGWTTMFSLTNKQPIRGLRNLGILACYILAVVMCVRLRFVSALVTWCAFGIAAGALYNLYELVAFARNKAADKKLGASFANFIHGPLAWPIMIPESIEYLLAELGVLPATPLPEAAKPDALPAQADTK